MAIENRTKKLRKVFDELSGNSLVLPNFQRGFVWSKDKQKSLVASLLVELPFGSLLILEGDAQDFTKRQLCFQEALDIDHSCEYVLDGQQRLSTLRTVFFDLFSSTDWEQVWAKTYGSLRNRWFLRVIPTEDEQDLFGYRTLSYKQMSEYIDSDIIDFIECKQIHKTKKTETHHPVYAPLDASQQPLRGIAQVKNALAREYSDAGIVPLFELGMGRRGIHRLVLDKIAQKRVDELKAELEDSQFDMELLLKQLAGLSYSQNDLEDILDGCEEIDQKSAALTDSWANLKAQWVEQFSNGLEDILDKEISIIHLERNEVDRAVAIFEAINRGGEPLTVYDLIVAKSARDAGAENMSMRILSAIDTNIRIAEGVNRMYASENQANDVVLWKANSMDIAKDNEPVKSFKDWFVNVLSLLVYVKGNGEACSVDHIKRQKILELTPSQVNENADAAIAAVQRALCFLQLRCGVRDAASVKYSLMLVVLAYYLDDDQVWNDTQKLDVLEYWYWCTFLGGAYSKRQNEQCKEDIIDLNQLLSGQNKSRYQRWENNVLNYTDYATKEILLRKDDDVDREPGAVRDGILQFILSQCPSDFLNSNSNSDQDNPAKLSAWRWANGSLDLELHHVIPLAECTNLGDVSAQLRKDKNHQLNSCLNLAYITKSSNRTLSAISPSEYLSLMDRSSIANNYLPDISAFTQALESQNYDSVLERRWDLISGALTNHIDRLKRSI